jgi:hypothetical protein
MKRKFLSLLIIAGLFIFLTCGNEPPEGFYEGSPEDSVAIFGLLDDNAALTLTEDLFVGDWVPVVFGAVDFSSPTDQNYRNIDTIVKQLVDSVSFLGVTMTRYEDLWFARDTTCTVTLYDTFTTQCAVHYTERHTGYYFWGGDTSGDLDTVLVDYTGGYDTIDVQAVGKRVLFFDVERDPVWDEEAAETVMAVREPREWLLKRISYGDYDFPQPGSDVPLIAQVDIDDGEDTYTIVESSYDDTASGHIMNRFRSIDSLLGFGNGDSLEIEITVYNVVPGSLDVFFASVGGGGRTEITGLHSGTGTVIASGSGITNLFFEVAADEVFYYVVPQKEYNANVWLIPVDIGGAR